MLGKKNLKRQNLVKKLPQNSQNFQIDDFLEASDKNNNLIKNRIVSSLEQFFKHLERCSTGDNSDFIEGLIEKRRRDLFCEKNDQILEDNKEEYASLIYFKIQSELSKFPHEIANQSMKLIELFYTELLSNFQINIFQFYRYAITKVYDKVKPTPIGKTSKPESNDFNESRLEKSNKIMKILYAGMKLGELYLLEDMQFHSENVYYSMKEHQHRRNEKILKNIVEFTTRMKKKLDGLNRYRIFTRPEQPRLRFNSFRIRISDSLTKNKQNILRQKVEVNKLIMKNGSSAKPFLIRQKTKLKL